MLYSSFCNVLCTKSSLLIEFTHSMIILIILQYMCTSVLTNQQLGNKFYFGIFPLFSASLQETPFEMAIHVSTSTTEDNTQYHK